MKFAYSWLASYLPGPPPDPKKLGDRLTAVGFIVEGVEGTGDGRSDVRSRRTGPSMTTAARPQRPSRLRRPFADPEAPPCAPEAGPDVRALAAVVVTEPALCSVLARVIEA